MAPDGKPALHSRVDIYESTTCVLSIGWECNARDPGTPGEFKVLGPISLFRSNGLYVSTWNVANPHTAIQLARALVLLKAKSH
jgi:hypothetical protein